MQLNPATTPAACAAPPMTAAQVRCLGTPEIVYLKCAMRDGERVFVIYGADGIPLEEVDTFEAAMASTAENDAHIVSVH